MARVSRTVMMFVGGGALLALTGCERIEQAATDAVEQAKQSATQVLEEATQTGSIEDAAQAADQVLLETRQQAAELLEQMSNYLSVDRPSTPSGRVAPAPES